MIEPPFQSTAAIETLRQRAAILRSIRGFFDDAGFFEVQTPTLSSETMVDLHIDPVTVAREALQLSLPHAHSDLYLQSSPEFAMKRLLACGADAIYQICPAFRAGERGTNHNPEFMMLEWYRMGDRFEEGIQLLSQLVDRVTDRPACQQMTYQAAFEAFAQFDPLTATLPQLREAAARLGIDLTGLDFEHVDDWLNLIFDHAVVPNLGRGQPTILTHYPSSQAALALICRDDPRTAERFELFIDGIELANGYGELLDAEELLRRCDENNRARMEMGKPGLPMPRQLYRAMQHGISTCSGCALGVDRFVAVLLGKRELSETLTFPIDRA
ncbi:EF-P lysine aminoacylase EpmA [Rosistilla oblonga]|uniref:Elongation factor P--(R)-beta-lysine ligase n=1 Tax=Rosistilla oblonga TaxID=2527990 RepID=A0A518IRH9_9BACT|nr:EF-P lysine aminoacylase EpmA [Rosistilla oblonga]QDV55653.1 Elongation factor P--(R)-beta-lysine ligase [Rosistilla oblonga]